MNPALDQHLWWYMARSGGLVAWWTVSASVLWGLAVSTRLIRRRGLPAWLLDLHRFLGALSAVFTAIHVAGLVADSYVHFGPSEILVPLASKWHPLAVAWGVVGLYLLAAIEVTSLVMKRLPRRWWRAVHLTSFALFVASTGHALSAGTDRRNPAVQWSALAIGAAFVFLVVYRQLAARSTGRPDRISQRARTSATAAGDTADSGGAAVPARTAPAAADARVVALAERAARARAARAERAGGLPARQQDAVPAGEVAAHLDRGEPRRPGEVGGGGRLARRDLHHEDTRAGQPAGRLADDALDVLDA